MQRQRLLGVMFLMVVTGLSLAGCSTGGTDPPTDESVRISVGDVEIAGVSGLSLVPLRSPDSSHIAFSGLFGGTITRFAQLGTGRIVYASTHQQALGEIYVARPDGLGAVRLTSNTVADEGPDWAPDGQTIAFATNRDGNYEIYTMRADGSAVTRLTNVAADDHSPSWSPDGASIYFVSTRDADTEIYRMAANGTGQTRLTNSVGADEWPDCSPDARSVAFVSDRGGTPQVYTMNVDGSAQTALTSGATHSHPAWSPDSGRIISVQDDGSVRSILSSLTDGSSNTILLQEEANLAVPEPSPDGSRIMYRRNGQLWSMDASGSDPRPIAGGGTGETYRASWSGNTAHVVRTYIGAAGSDQGSNPAFGTQRPLVIVGLREAGLVQAVTVEVPVAHFGTVTAAGMEGTGDELVGVEIEAYQITGVWEDQGRAITPRIWNSSAGFTTKAVLVFFSARTGRITSVLSATVAAAAESSAPRARIEGDRVIVSGPFTSVLTAPGQEAAPGGAAEVELTAGSGEVIAVR